MNKIVVILSEIILFLFNLIVCLQFGGVIELSPVLYEMDIIVIIGIVDAINVVFACVYKVNKKVVEGKTPIPRSEKSPVPAGEKVLVPAGEKVLAPAGEKIPVPTGEKMPVPTDERIPVPVSEKEPGETGIKVIKPIERDNYTIKIYKYTETRKFIVCGCCDVNNEEGTDNCILCGSPLMGGTYGR